MPNSQIITNQETLLGDVINNILPSCNNVYLLAGYFYFSGFKEIYKALSDKKIRLLVGMDLERDMANKINEVEHLNIGSPSNAMVKDQYYKGLVEAFNETDNFDSQDAVEAFTLFITKLGDGSLEIRKTKQPNHAKLYLFENKPEYAQGGDFPGTVITGSSNLTRSGLAGQFEVNVVFRDGNYNYCKKEIFDKLWTDEFSLKIDFNDFTKNVIEKTWLPCNFTPYHMYLRVLHEYFSMVEDKGYKMPASITNQKYLNLKYQIDIINYSIEKLQQHSGVIVADVVGLGKSIVASAIAHNLRLKTIIIAPPHLKEQWDEYRHEFDFNALVFGSGSIQEALKAINSDEERLIIVDEAHKYRNGLTEDYADLRKLCVGNKVLLLTATPFNNKPQDIFTMISLFQLAAKSTIRTEENLSEKFVLLSREYKNIKNNQKEKKETVVITQQRLKDLAKRIRVIINPVVIRRSRLDLDNIEVYKNDLKKQGISFPVVDGPIIKSYNLGALGELYCNTLAAIIPAEEENSGKGFIGARYKPSSYLKQEVRKKYDQVIEGDFGDFNLFEESQKNIAKFMKRLLVARFESSIYAFQMTLDNIIYSYENIIAWYSKGKKVPIFKKGKLPGIEELAELNGEEMDEVLEKIDLEKLLDKESKLKKYYEKGLVFINSEDLVAEFENHMKHDIILLKEIRKNWFEGEIKRDPKIEDFIKIVREELGKNPKRKIVVFSEFADTINYLNDKLKDKIRVFKYTSADGTKENKKTIKTNFDASLETNLQTDDYDVLLATDAISEGFNLHRAGIIFNYDIPYNPTRVIQRVGRINRINKKVFNTLYIYNYFPSPTGEKEIRKKQIATLKMDMIHALMGEDTKYLTNEEQLQSFFREQYKNYSFEELSWETEYRNLYYQLVSHKDKDLEYAKTIPHRARLRRGKNVKPEGVLVFASKSGDFVFKHGLHGGEISTKAVEDAFSMLKADKTEKALNVTYNYYPTYTKTRENLFIKKSHVEIDKGKRDTITKLRAVIKSTNDVITPFLDYLTDVLRIIEELDALPERYLKQIRGISEKTLKNDLEKLFKDVPPDYIGKIFKKADKIEEGEEILILSEEM